VFPVILVHFPSFFFYDIIELDSLASYEVDILSLDGVRERREEGGDEKKRREKR
jgi:hypothetical protein